VPWWVLGYLAFLVLLSDASAVADARCGPRPPGIWPRDRESCTFAASMPPRHDALASPRSKSAPLRAAVLCAARAPVWRDRRDFLHWPATALVG
jgi:hypothetical protein